MTEFLKIRISKEYMKRKIRAASNLGVHDYWFPDGAPCCAVGHIVCEVIIHPQVAIQFRNNILASFRNHVADAFLDAVDPTAYADTSLTGVNDLASDADRRNNVLEWLEEHAAEIVEFEV